MCLGLVLERLFLQYTYFFVSVSGQTSQPHATTQNRFQNSTSANHTPQHQMLSDQDFSQSHATAQTRFQTGLQPTASHSTKSLSDQDLSQTHATVPNHFQTRTSANHTQQNKLAFRPGLQPTTRNNTKSLSVSDQDLSYNSKLYPQ